MVLSLLLLHLAAAPAVLQDVKVEVEDPELRPWAEKARDLIVEWYPKIERILGMPEDAPRKNVTLVLETHGNGVAATGGGRITVNGDWVRDHPEDIGLVVHELAHVIQGYPKYDPSWLVEGIADYVRWCNFEPHAAWPRANPRAADYRHGYREVGTFLDWACRKYDKTLVRKLDAALKSGAYDASIWQEMTHEPLDELWPEFVTALGPATEPTPQTREWESLAYGMFIHFGLGTMNFDEFGLKNAPTSAFNPTDLDVDQWIHVAKDAGMKYAVLTTKHCTGHCLWPTKQTNRGVAFSPNRTDVVRLFVDACRKYGVKPGFYYLLGWDSYHQPMRSPEQYRAFCLAQIEELLTDYGPITELWLDIPWDMGPDTRGALHEIYTRVKTLQPDCRVLFNQGFVDGSEVRIGAASYRGENEPGVAPVPLWPKDLVNGERTLPPPEGHNPRIEFQGQTYYLPHETCETILRDWFWREDDPLKSLPTLYRLYRAAVDRKSNLLLNVGPDKTGRIRPEAIARLMELKRAMSDPSVVPKNLAEGKKTTASTVWEDDPYWAPDRILDPNTLGGARWAARAEDKQCWMRIDFGEPTTLDAVYITEMWSRTRGFRIEALLPDGSWKTVYEGDRLPLDGKPLRFDEVTATAVRFTAKDATIGPSLTDFEVYRLGPERPSRER